MSDLLNEILSRIFRGSDLLVALVALFVIMVYISWSFTARKVRKKVQGLILPCAFIVLCAVIVMVFIHVVSEHRNTLVNTFNKDEIGVLVLQMVGDDDQNSLQRDL